jgi:outer membrane protein assembly factor BamB
MWTLALACLAIAVPIRGDGDGTDWPSFRGAFASGIAEGYATPAKWDVAEGTNVLWRTPIPGLAHSSPVIVGERLFVTTAVGEGEAVLNEVGKGRTGDYGDVWSLPAEGVQRFQVLCLDKRTGAIRWTATAFEGEPRFKRHPKSSFAASTPAADAGHVVAFFGSEGLYGYDHEGKQLWKKDLGELNGAFYMAPTAEWGVGSSPVIHEGRVYLQVDVIGKAFLACFDVATGEELWRAVRDDVPTWGSPTVHVGLDRSQVIANGYKHIGGYDLETGKELWKLVGGGDIPTPTPIVANDLIFITSSHGRLSPIYAVHVDAEGPVSADAGAEGAEHMAWSNPRRGNYMPTPLVYGDELYLCNDAGILSCFASLSGEEHYRERLSSGASAYTASPVAADGKLYCTSEDGEVQVVELGKQFAVLEINDLGETCMATPAISAGVLYWRTRGHVIAIGNESSDG